MKLFNKVAIVGVGLIGGSIGLAIKKKKVADTVIGVFRRRSTLQKALKSHAVDFGTLNLKEGVKDADLIIIATPVSLITKMASEIIKYAKSGALITDVGSTKKEIVDRIEKITAGSKGMHFIGSHPMAGAEHTGVLHAKEDLLKNAVCIITRSTHTDKISLGIIGCFWKMLGAEVSILTPAEHDRIVSIISHLPHAAAFALAGVVSQDETYYAAEGFKDTTRIASSDPELWADIFFSNKKEILRAGKLFIDHYQKIHAAIANGRRKELVKLLAAAKEKRDTVAQQCGKEHA